MIWISVVGKFKDSVDLVWAFFKKVYLYLDLDLKIAEFEFEIHLLQS